MANRYPKDKDEQSREEASASSLHVYEDAVTKRSISEVIKRHSDRLMSIPGVVGIAEGESGGKPCLLVFIAKSDSALLTRLPGSLEGYLIQVEESGEFRKR
jgi:hypothetical protein